MAAFAPEIFPKIRHTYLVSESEACALFTFRSLQRQGLLRDLVKVRFASFYTRSPISHRKSDGFVLCDAGNYVVVSVVQRIILLP